MSSAYLLLKLLHLSSYHFGFMMLFYGSFYLVSGLLATQLIQRGHLNYLVFSGSAFIFCGGLLMLVLHLLVGISVTVILLPMLLTVLGVTLARPTAITQALVENREKAGVCSAALGLFQYAGAGLLSLLITLVENRTQLALAFLFMVSGVIIFLLQARAQRTI